MKKYFSLITFSHTVFALPFALIGFFLAFRQAELTSFPWKNFVLMLFCMVFARSAAMAFNRYLDRNIDALNPRTQNRELPVGKIPAKSALIFTMLCAILFIGSTYYINLLCFYLSPLALFVILFYSYTKRFTAACHLVLGLGLSFAPLGAYFSLNPIWSFPAFLFALAVLCWVAGFDIIYALQDENFDKAQGLHALPAKFGKAKALYMARILHAVSVIAVLFAGHQAKLGLFYWIGTLLFTALLVLQHQKAKPLDVRKVDFSFMTNNGLASILFASFFLLDTYICLTY